MWSCGGGSSFSLTDPGTLTAVADEPFAYQATADNPPVPDNLSFHLESGPAGLSVSPDGLVAWTPQMDQVGLHELKLRADGGEGTASRSYDLEVLREAPIRAGFDAPPLPPDRPTTLPDGYRFLFEGPDPIQIGVVEGTMEAKRMAVLLGRVEDREGAPLPGVRVAVKDHPELGFTRTTQDGRYALALNAGGSMVLRFSRPGHLSAERPLASRWGAYLQLDPVVLIPMSEVATPVQLGSAQGPQAARGDVESDADGDRQATLLFRPGTRAEAVGPDGERTPLSELTLRVTEYTVGETGPRAMPAGLPPRSGYTYAFEVTADEARSKNAPDVALSQPVPFYVENFLNFPVGGPVPVGVYRPSSSTWEAEPDGRVLQVVNIQNGRAQLDTDGDGEADGPEALSALHIDAEELGVLAQRFEAGQSFWRVEMAHFSTWDCNWPFGPPPGSPAPFPDSDDVPDVDDMDPKDPDCEQPGSIIECESGGLGQEIPLVGTDFFLAYRSRRTPGYRSGRTARIPVTGSELPPDLARIYLEIEVAGQKHALDFAPASNLVHAFEWDGNDAFGRPFVGDAELRSRVGFAYPATYRGASAQGSGGGGGGGGFGRSGNVTILGGTRATTDLRGVRAVIWSTLPPVFLRGTPVEREAFGGFTLSAEHRLLQDRVELGKNGTYLPAQFSSKTSRC